MFKNIATRNSMMTLRTTGPTTPTINLTIAADTNNYNLFTAAGSPAYNCIVNLTINGTGGVISGNGKVVIWSASSSLSGLIISGFTAGSTINIINNGYIIGAGGAGGHGGEIWASNGDAGGTALWIANNINLNNTNGYIFGGGGGGGSATVWDYNSAGGGGGQGYYGGTGGTADGGGTGGNGSFLGPGAGVGIISYSHSGAGGTWGAAGETAPYDDNNTVGGAGGNAIILNGKSINWLGGYAPGSQILGAII